MKEINGQSSVRGPAQRAEEVFLTLSLQELAAHDLKSPSYKNSTGTTPYFIKSNSSGVTKFE
jgi:hypothetical protein